ncbi:unnamed protein product [Clonostachys solani]|uniref:O-methylsterigmatocystin oxidoreductase n=1 Tax=Clonostachys solani TaxID=160281 RepID=A0A9N9ZKR7_9HYPO|nr:unnamed protein product [Clonostachys solani]
MFSSSLWPLWAIAAPLLVYAINRIFLHRDDHYRLPPGPPGLPLVGNIRDLPPADMPEFRHWMKHKDQYGPISSVTIMGMTLIIVNDKDMAHEILDKTASKTSGRPDSIFANKMCGYESIILCKGYNKTFRFYRKLLHQELGTITSAAQFRGIQELEMKRQLIRTLKAPEKLLDHYRTSAAATILKMAYGYTLEPHKPDYLVELADRVLSEFSQAAVPMSWLVDILPFLQYLPKGMPGAEFITKARIMRRRLETAAELPFRFVQRQMTAKNYQPSYVSKLIDYFTPSDGDSPSLGSADEDAIMWTAMSLYGAASDTTVITLTAFTAAMILYPDVQRKAQGEIDRVVGFGKLPTFEDRDKLPYVNALIKEAARWWPITPLGFPHVVDSDFDYNGFRIPKGATILPSVYGFLHDPQVYHEPESFEPERFLAPRNEPDPASDVFGYGRRICPGRFFADSSLYINIVQSLSMFDFRHAVGDDGQEVSISLEPQPGILTHPNKFQYLITPRSRQHIDLINQLEVDTPWELSDAEHLQNAAMQ